ncbi:MAG: diacylglycerol kinase family protein [Bacteroidetes bacterium]|nr:diacylglycerol kinase family protein [Bacteroidota bacterium]
MIKLIKSFGYALKGLFFALKEQQNMRIHAVAILVVTIAGIFLGLTAIEWSVIALTFSSVIVAEMFNTAIEDLVDLVSPDFNKKAGRIKDIAAGAVLLAAIVATVVGVYIFGNKIFNLLL